MKGTYSKFGFGRMNLDTFVWLTIFMLMGCIAWGGGEAPENIIQNGGFELDFQNWLFWTEGGAVASREIISGKKGDPIDGKNVAYVKIANGGAGFNHIQFYQGPFMLKKETKYTFCVWGKSDGGPRPVRLSVLKHADPWTGYAQKDVTFDVSWNEYTVTFTQPVDDNNSRIDIFLGTSDVDVWLDHVRLYEGKYFNDKVRELPGQFVKRYDKLTVSWGMIKTLP